MQRLADAGAAVPPVIDQGSDHDGRPYFAMPWYSATLQARVDSGTYASDLCAGLAFLTRLAEILMGIHELDLAHRDLKPPNVLLDGDRPILTDYGLSISASEEADAQRFTATEEQIGSRYYIAPENEKGFNEDVDQYPADYYAFAKVAWVVLAGRRPHAREDQLLIENRLASLHNDANLEPMDALFEDLLVVDPRARLDDWQVVLRALERVASRYTGEPDAGGQDDAVSKAMELVEKWRTSTPGIAAVKRDEAAARRVADRQRFRDALARAQSERTAELQEISERAPLLHVGVGGGSLLGGPPSDWPPSPETVQRAGLDPPEGLDRNDQDVSQSFMQPAHVAFTIHVQGDDPAELQLGLWPIFQGDKVWVVRSVLLLGRAPHEIRQLPGLNPRYGTWCEALPVHLNTSLEVAEQLGRDLVDQGLAIFGECVGHLAEGRSVADPRTWGT
jgi:hypothetical protein